MDFKELPQEVVELLCDAFTRGRAESDKDLPNPYTLTTMQFAYEYGKKHGIEIRNYIDGHNQPCYYCKELTNSFAGSPRKWPLGFTHRDGTGIVRWHHTGCVQDRLFKEES